MKRFTLFKSYINLPRNVYILFFADIVNSAGSFVYPFLAMFLTLKLGYSEYYSGFILTIVIAAEGVGKLIGGKLADWIGRKIVIIVLSTLGAGYLHNNSFPERINYNSLSYNLSRFFKIRGNAGNKCFTDRFHN